MIVGQCHNRQNDGPGQSCFSDGQRESALHERDDHDQSEEAVDDGRNAGQQFDDRFEQVAQPVAGQFGHVDGDGQPEGQCNEDCGDRDPQRAEDQRQYAELRRGLCGGVPQFAAQKTRRRDFAFVEYASGEILGDQLFRQVGDDVLVRGNDAA